MNVIIQLSCGTLLSIPFGRSVNSSIVKLPPEQDDRMTSTDFRLESCCTLFA
jgi:hypothetical protein